LWGPGALLAKQDIGQDDQFAHDRDDTRLVGLAGIAEPFGEAAQVWVPVDCRQRSHVDNIARSSAAPRTWRFPEDVPLSRAYGATPGRAAACRLPIVPSSGIQAIRAAAVIGPTPVMDVRMAEACA